MVLVFFFFKQKTAYEMLRSLVGSEMCIRDRSKTVLFDKEVDPETTTAKYRQDGILEIVVPFSKSVASRKVIVQ